MKDQSDAIWRRAFAGGRPRLFPTPGDLWSAAITYFEWCDQNPWHRNEAVKAGDHFGEIVNIPTQRPYTIEALCIFLDIHRTTFDDYATNPKYEEFFGVAQKIKDVIRNQKFEGAAVGAFNANIIARDLGLADTRKHEVTKPVIIDWTNPQTEGSPSNS